MRRSDLDASLEYAETRTRVDFAVARVVGEHIDPLRTALHQIAAQPPGRVELPALAVALHAVTSRLDEAQLQDAGEFHGCLVCLARTLLERPYIE